MFFCHTPKKWGYGTPTQPLQKVGVRVTPVNYGYGGKGKVKHLLASKHHSGHRGLFLAIRCDAMARASGSGMRNMGGGALQRGPGGPWPFHNFGWVGHNAFGPTNNWPVCSLILHCSQLILRKISKIGAIKCQILRLKCTKFTFCSPDPAGRAYSWGSLQCPQTPASI